MTVDLVPSKPPAGALRRAGFEMLPAIITDEGEKTSKTFLEFFTVTIRNPNTRASYARAVRYFLDWLLKDRGRSLRWLSLESGRDYKTLWDFANEKHGGCRYDVLESICRALDVTPGDILILGEGKRRPPRPGTPRS